MYVKKYTNTQKTFPDLTICPNEVQMLSLKTIKQLRINEGHLSKVTVQLRSGPKIIIFAPSTKSLNSEEPLI